MLQNLKPENLPEKFVSLAREVIDELLRNFPVVESRLLKERSEMLATDLLAIDPETFGSELSPFKTVPPIGDEGSREEGFFKLVTSEPFEYEYTIGDVVGNTEEISPEDEDFDISNEDIPEEPEMSMEQMIDDILQSGHGDERYVLEDMPEGEEPGPDDIVLGGGAHVSGIEAPKKTERTPVNLNESLKLSKYLF